MSGSILIRPKSYFTARRNSNQNVNNGVITRVIFNEELLDTHNQYNSSTGVFTCGVPGFYTFHSFCRIVTTSPAKLVDVYYYFLKNNNIQILTDNPRNLNLAVTICKATYSSYMNVGDILETQMLFGTDNGAGATIEYLQNYELAHFSGYKLD